MIARLTGTMHELALDEVIVDVGGVGYHVHVPIGTAQRAERAPDGSVTLTIYTAVREDAIQLFGFASEREKTVYRKLISVSGVGPRIGLNVLSGLSVEDIVAAVRTEDYRPLTQVNGIGKKTAQRLLLELRTAFDDLPVSVGTDHTDASTAREDAPLADARSALMNLGYPPATIDDVITRLAPLAEEGEPAESLVRKALKLLRS